MIKRTLYFGNPAYLSMRLDQLEHRIPSVEKNKDLSESFKEEVVTRIPIEDIGLVILDHKQITITHGLCEKLIGRNVSVLWCDSSHHPTGLLLPISSNDTQSEKLKYQLEASEPLKKQLWKQTVEQKVKNQAAVLNYFGKDAQALEHLSTEVKSGDTGNTEARAAAIYWGRLLETFDTNRGRYEAPPNHMLNYGYAILRAIVARSLVGSGCLPVLGIHHRNKYNHYCLADDIMEPYRPFVDKMVLEYINENEFLPNDLGREEKKHLLSLPFLDVLMEDKTSPLMVASQRTTASLMRCFMGESRRIIYPEIT
ncbi:MAG: type II CRISPR-associated endonuclease Cas1 [Cytophagales bacterium]|nr:type II CRISPR-associated endonuclease Cas1 [Cytophagales bacterium]